MRPTWGLIYWPIAMCAVVMMFAPAELIALFSNSKNTLSYFSQYELGLKGVTVTVHDPAWWISLSGWLLFVVVITGHLWFLTPD